MIDLRFMLSRRGGGLLESERPLRRGGVEERRLRRGGVFGSDSDSESESEESVESESEEESESDDDEDSFSSIARRCSIISFGAFCKKSSVSNRCK